MFSSSAVPPVRDTRPYRARLRRGRVPAAAVLALALLGGCRAAEPATAGSSPSPEPSAVAFEALAPDVYQPCGISPGPAAVWVLACSGKAVKVPSGDGAARTVRTIDGELVGIDSMSGDGSTKVWVISAKGIGSARRGMVAVLDAASGKADATVELGSSVPLHAAFVAGTLWVSTVDGGLYAVDGTSARRVATGPPVVWIVTEGQRTWTVAENGTVTERAVDGAAKRTFAGVLANANAAGAGLGSVWLASEEGVVRLDSATGSPTTVEVTGTVNNIEFCGGHMWLSQPDFGLRSLDAAAKVVRSIRLEVAPSYLLCDAGRLWVLSQDGKLGSIATG